MMAYSILPITNYAGPACTVAIFSNKGEKVYNKDFQLTQAYQLLNIDMRKHGAGIYYVVLSDANGTKLKTGKVLVR